MRPIFLLAALPFGGILGGITFATRSFAVMREQSA
jgi:hypothetical protein